MPDRFAEPGVLMTAPPAPTNKLDRNGADPHKVLEQVRTVLTNHCVVTQAVPATEHELDEMLPSDSADLLEQLAEWDEESLVRWVAGDSQADWAVQRLRSLCQAGQLFPVLFGASLKGVGITALLDGVIELLPPPPAPATSNLAGVVFKLERDPVMGRGGYVRLYSGELSVRDTVRVAGRPEPVRIVQIRRHLADRTLDISRIGTGDLAALCGLTGVRAGDVLGDPNGVPPVFQLAKPVLQVKVQPALTQDLPKLLSALEELADEDPHLGVDYLADVRELNLTVMGTVQVEVTQAVLQSRFGLSAHFDPPTVMYREAPVGAGECESSYFLGNSYAIVRFRIEPGPPGSGLTYVNETRHDKLRPQFEAEAVRAGLETIQQGMSG
jgi:ribosomal protection tetracycline resistance protein